jgi:hypothetical protein
MRNKEKQGTTHLQIDTPSSDVVVSRLSLLWSLVRPEKSSEVQDTGYPISVSGKYPSARGESAIIDPI